MFDHLVEIDDVYVFPQVIINEWEGKPRCLPAALDYASKGWLVFPAPRDSRKSHKSAEYSNGRRWGATADADEIRDDFTRWPLANVGIPCGEENAIWVLDVDTKEGHGVDGIASLQALIDEHGELPPTFRVESPSGSLHYYWNWPLDKIITNSASRIGPGIDIRGEGGMVLAPPSVRIPIGVYSIVCNAEIANAPSWLVDLAIAAGNGGGIPDGERQPNPDLEAPLSWVAAAADVIPNDDLDWETWNTRGMAFFAATGGSAEGFVLFDKFSAKSAKYNKTRTIDKWRSYHSSPPNRVGFGSLHHLASQADPNWLNDLEAQDTADLHAAAMDPEFHGDSGDADDATADLGGARAERANGHHQSGNGSGNGFDAKAETKDETKSDAKSDAKSETKDDQHQEQKSNLHIVQVSEVEAKAYSWLWKSRIARGKVSLLVGMPDVNKSTLALDLTARITKGDVLPNGEGRSPLGNVIILSAEDDVADTIRPRLEVAGADLTRVHAITAVKLKNNGRRTFDLTQDIARLEQAVRFIGNVMMIVIDPYSAYMGKPGKMDSYRSTDVRATLAPLFDMASRLEVAVLGIGHLNKSGSMPALLRVLDLVAFVAASRSVYLVARDPEDDERRLFVPAKNNIGRIRTGLGFKIVEKLATTVFDAYPAVRWEDGDVTMTADEALSWREDGRRSEVKEQAKTLLRELLANGAMRQQDVQAKAEERGITLRVLKTAKKDLGVVSSKIERVWWWSLPTTTQPM